MHNIKSILKWSNIWLQILSQNVSISEATNGATGKWTIEGKITKKYKILKKNTFTIVEWILKQEKHTII